jgi:hypothetical protein
VSIVHVKTSDWIEPLEIDGVIIQGTLFYFLCIFYSLFQLETFFRCLFLLGSPFLKGTGESFLQL